MTIINGKTKLLGLLGDPVNHSLSPSMHNAAFKKMGLDWCYLAMPCKKENLNSVMQGLLEINCNGLNITIPHKNNVAKLCTELSPLAKRLGAVNTILPHTKGGWYGTNTDMEGFLAPLKEKKNFQVGKAIIIGCGGSARAVLAGLEELGHKDITIINRSKNTLENFIQDLSKNAIIRSENIQLKGLLESDKEIIEEIKNANLIINTTPIGMYSKKNEKEQTISLPINQEVWLNLNKETTLYDLIYTPRPTNWLKQGHEIGCETIDGLEMLIQQGAASLRIWSGISEIPINEMRKAAENQLKI